MVHLVGDVIVIAVTVRVVSRLRCCWLWRLPHDDSSAAEDIRILHIEFKEGVRENCSSQSGEKLAHMWQQSTRRWRLVITKARQSITGEERSAAAYDGSRIEDAAHPFCLLLLVPSLINN